MKLLTNKRWEMIVLFCLTTTGTNIRGLSKQKSWQNGEQLKICEGSFTWGVTGVHLTGQWNTELDALLIIDWTKEKPIYQDFVQRILGNGNANSFSFKNVSYLQVAMKVKQDNISYAKISVDVFELYAFNPNFIVFNFVFWNWYWY